MPTQLPRFLPFSRLTSPIETPAFYWKDRVNKLFPITIKMANIETKAEDNWGKKRDDSLGGFPTGTACGWEASTRSAVETATASGKVGVPKIWKKLCSLNDLDLGTLCRESLRHCSLRTERELLRVSGHRQLPSLNGLDSFIEISTPIDQGVQPWAQWWMGPFVYQWFPWCWWHLGESRIDISESVHYRASDPMADLCQAGIGDASEFADDIFTWQRIDFLEGKVGHPL